MNINGWGDFMLIIKKILIVIACVISCLVVISTILYFILDWTSPDISPQEDEDLIMEEIDIPLSNAYDDLSTIDGEMIQWPEDDENANKIDNMIDGKIWDEIFVTELIDNNIENLETFEKALKKESYQSTIHAAGNRFENENWADNTALKALKLSKIRILQAMDDLKKRGTNTASQTLLKVAQLGYKIQYSRTTVIGALTGIKIKEIVLNVIDNNKTKLNLTGEDKDILIGLYSENNSWYVNSEKMEYAPWIELDNSNEIYRRITGESNVPLDFRIFASNSYYFKPNLTKKLYADHYRNRIKQSVVCGSYSASDAILEEPKIYENNYIGKLQLNLIFVSSGSYSQKDCKNKELIEKILTN